jgi:type I restriction enzyme S subunit
MVTIRSSKLERTLRIDAEFFRRSYMRASEAVRSSRHDDVASVSDVSDGNHFTISSDFVEDGIAYYRGQDVVGNFFIEQSSPNHITRGAFDRPYMERSHLKTGDVLLSIIGTIGELSLVASHEPATCSCKLAILRPTSIAPEFLAVALRSKVGRLQIERLTRGAVQMGLILEDMDQLLVPRFNSSLENRIIELVQTSKHAREQSSRALSQAEDHLTRCIGLADWSPPEPLAYSTSVAAVRSAGRLDAEYFAPRIRELIGRLGKQGQILGDVAPSRREKFDPSLPGGFEYIEIGDVTGDGTASSTRLERAEAPSRATWHVRPGDVITSTVRPIRRLSATIEDNQDGFVCSSGFVVLRPEKVRPEVLLTYLRLPVLCELMDLHTSASMYPAISEKDLLRLPFASPDNPTETAICDAFSKARDARRRGAKLIESARRAVEMAIEQDEPAALRFLDETED